MAGPDYAWWHRRYEDAKNFLMRFCRKSSILQEMNFMKNFPKNTFNLISDTNGI